jgi:hypothetical protein
VFELAFATLAAATLRCTAPPPVPPGLPAGSTYVSDARPPARFQHEARSTVVTVPAAEVDRLCRPPGEPPVCGARILACTQDGVITAPNPCAFRGDAYAELLCHEQAHRNGWPGTHGP